MIPEVQEKEGEYFLMYGDIGLNVEVIRLFVELFEVDEDIFDDVLNLLETIVKKLQVRSPVIRS